MFLWQKNKSTTLNDVIEYDDKFYDTIIPGAIKSANEIIPLVIDFISPKSVIDVGCGTGAWLCIWQKYGVTDFLGIDGKHINTNKLLIPVNNFIQQDLEADFSINRKFDLACCLEVAEHLRAQTAESFIQRLCNLSDVVLFSAAIPGQEGTCHINEQYPSYWNRLFNKNNFILADCIRNKIWMNKNINVWYRQNMLLFVKKSYVIQSELLTEFAQHTNEFFIDLVHPEYFDYKSEKLLQNQRLFDKNKSCFLKRFLPTKSVYNKYFIFIKS